MAEKSLEKKTRIIISECVRGEAKRMCGKKNWGCIIKYSSHPKKRWGLGIWVGEIGEREKLRSDKILIRILSRKPF